MAVGLLVGTAVMVGLLIAVLLASTRGRGWYRYTPQTSLEDVGWSPARGVESGAGLLSRPGTWIAVFFVTMALVVGGVFAFAAGSSLGGMTTVLLGGIGLLVVAYLVGGVYLVARQRGHSNAMAVFESITASGAVFVLIIVVQLVA